MAAVVVADSVVKAAVKALAEKGGSSRAAILKYLLTNKLGNNVSKWLVVCSFLGLFYFFEILL